MWLLEVTYQGREGLWWRCSKALFGWETKEMQEAGRVVVTSEGLFDRVREEWWDLPARNNGDLV